MDDPFAQCELCGCIFFVGGEVGLCTSCSSKGHCCCPACEDDADRSFLPGDPTGHARVSTTSEITQSVRDDQVHLPEASSLAQSCSNLNLSDEAENIVDGETTTNDTASSTTTDGEDLDIDIGIDIGIDIHTILHNRPQTLVYTLLIDSFRLRRHDDALSHLPSWTNLELAGLLTRKPCLAQFRRFLYLAQTRPGLLPYWWITEKDKSMSVCVGLGMQKPGVWACLRQDVDEGDLREYYGGRKMVRVLRGLAEVVYGGVESWVVGEVLRERVARKRMEEGEGEGGEEGEDGGREDEGDGREDEKE
ncbi:uncharacterized protein EI97DRAFT_454875 [Westerdykella ornata]|uniref:Uncharacterized protein n=1 Tax=Westerdykella ornata TaxID=318751 RepID=A0A6A6JTN9_WESOR|nr:uncharacterized protein EI97DRAFT_454875 [Westerdykella ornata]KAF2279932.1 hypothetical protein EI97DRAFT_454875 [Westerdykella ornata]